MQLHHLGSIAPGRGSGLLRKVPREEPGGWPSEWGGERGGVRAWRLLTLKKQSCVIWHAAALSVPRPTGKGCRDLEQLPGRAGVSHSGDIPNPPGRVSAAPAPGDRALAGGLDGIFSRGPSQPRSFWDSVGWSLSLGGGWWRCPAPGLHFSRRSQALEKHWDVQGMGRSC